MKIRFAVLALVLRRALRVIRRRSAARAIPCRVCRAPQRRCARRDDARSHRQPRRHVDAAQRNARHVGPGEARRHAHRRNFALPLARRPARGDRVQLQAGQRGQEPHAARHVFEWRGAVEEGGETFRYAIVPGLVDRHAVTLAIATDLKRNAQTFDYKVAVKDHVEDMRYERAGDESVKAPGRHVRNGADAPRRRARARTASASRAAGFRQSSAGCRSRSSSPRRKATRSR